MAVAIECCNLFVRFDALSKVFPGGPAAMWDPSTAPGIHDGKVVRFGAMSDQGLMQIYSELLEMGLKSGKDIGAFGVPWIEMNPEFAGQASVRLKGCQDGILIDSDNFNDFLLGKVKPLSVRATAIIQIEGKTLLVKEKRDNAFSLPGGTLNRHERALAAAIREVYEELGLTAYRAERLPHADFKGKYRYHLVSRLDIDSHDEIKLDRRELSDFFWWNGIEEIPLTSHVKDILKFVK